MRDKAGVATMFGLLEMLLVIFLIEYPFRKIAYADYTLRHACAKLSRAAKSK